MSSAVVSKIDFSSSCGGGSWGGGVGADLLGWAAFRSAGGGCALLDRVDGPVLLVLEVQG